ncbi:hypothetical protein SLEP1_g42747 [Rubroshorea leprosula]|uniref:Uncharacterized protein n=1 Tax=Rubroshorea leprosula TaxID=152421 RepID=A0AAV5LAW5_9ROSI|nr:hypothetical protein SLEP1_g42747 [Rubroshorea leprosula]
MGERRQEKLEDFHGPLAIGRNKIRVNPIYIKAEKKSFWADFTRKNRSLYPATAGGREGRSRADPATFLQEREVLSSRLVLGQEENKIIKFSYQFLREVDDDEGWWCSAAGRKKTEQTRKWLGKRKKEKIKEKEMSQPALSNKSFNPFKV